MKTYAIIEGDLRSNCAGQIIRKLTTPEDVEYSQKYARLMRQNQSLLARGILRKHISEQTDTNPGDWKIIQLEDNSLIISKHDDTSSFFFSISHSKHKIAVALSESHRLGVDVQWIDKARNMQAILRRISPDNSDIPDELTQQYRLWTMYEAYFKAIPSASYQIPQALFKVVSQQPSEQPRALTIDSRQFTIQSWIRADHALSLCLPLP